MLKWGRNAQYGQERARFVAICALMGLMLLVGGAQASWATEQYAQKEGRACQYCHVSGSPGTINVDTGRRETLEVNVRGRYYQTHSHTFEGYVEPRVRPNAPLPLFTFIAREMLPDNARRIAVADVTGDHIPRLITLNVKPDTKDSSVLTVKKWDGKGYVTEFSGDAPGGAEKLAVGHFTNDGKMVIVTERSAWQWNGKTYVRKDAAQPLNITGTVRLRTDGAERLLAASSSTDLRAYRVDPGSASLLADPIPAPNGQVVQMDMHNSPEFFSKLGWPAELTQGGVLGLWTTPNRNQQLLYHVDLDQDIEVKNDPTGFAKPQLKLLSQGWKVAVVNPREPSLANQFFTPRLAGDILDVATESAHGEGTPGLLILTSEGVDKKGRSLYFFALNTTPGATSTVVPASAASTGK